MELMDCGSLADILQNHGELFMNELQIAIVIRDVSYLNIIFAFLWS